MPARLQKTAKPELIEKPGPHRGVLDLAHAAQNFSLHRYYPSERLAPFIEHFWIIHWDLRGRPDYTSEVLPHPAVNIAFTRERGWITGVTTDKYTYRLEGAGDVLGIQFRPGRPSGLGELRVVPSADAGDELTRRHRLGPPRDRFLELGDRKRPFDPSRLVPGVDSRARVVRV